MTTPENTQEDFGIEYYDDIVEKENTPQQSPLVRHPRRVLQRGAETVLGLPGDIVQFITSLAGPVPEEEKEQMDSGRKLWGSVLESIPTSSDIRARSAEVNPELEPKSELEGIADEFVEDVTALSIPVGGRVPFMKSIGTAFAGNLAKSGAKALNLSEGSQDLTKMGIMMFSGMFGKGRGLESYKNNLFKSARNSVNEGDVAKYNLKRMQNLRRDLMKGSMNDAKRPTLKILNEMEKKIKDGVIPVDESIQFDIDLGRAIRESGSDKQAKRNLLNLHSINNEALAEYGKTNPTFNESYKEANKIFQGLATSTAAKDFIKKNANLKNLSYSSALLGITPGALGMKMAGIGALGSGIYAAEVAKRIASNPALRRYYQNVLTASLNENKTQLMRNLSGLERVAKKEFDKEPFPTIELK